MWQEVAKALVERKLAIQNDLSELLNPMGRPTLADWLVGFRDSVNRNNDPNGGGRWRFLKHIIVRKADFERWLCKANKRRGPQSGTTGYQQSDRKMFSHISRLRREGKARSPYSAALILAREDKLAGTGAAESKAKRVSARYRKEHGGQSAETP